MPTVSEILKPMYESGFNNDTIADAVQKAYVVVNYSGHNKIMCSVSGGADSDIMLDILYRVDFDNKIDYVWFDTGVEYQATKKHLDFLENKYNIKIQRKRAIHTIPYCVNHYGQPFLSKLVSEVIARLQNYNFKWQDKDYESLVEEYPNCKTALKWWCNWNKANTFKDDASNTKPSRYDINYYPYLKKFLIKYPPQFKISNKCCDYAKKKVSQKVMRDNNYDLVVTGIRKSEGGIRAAIYKNCYTPKVEQSTYRPIFWFTNSDKDTYSKIFGVTHSDCYTKYGFKRTGCVCCPYGGRRCKEELEQTEKYEPKLYKAAINCFGDSYEYMQEYYKFRKLMQDKEKGRSPLFEM